MTTESRKPGIFIKTAHHVKIIIIKIMITTIIKNDNSNNNNNNNYGTVRFVEAIYPFFGGVGWVGGWFVEAIYPFLLEKKIRKPKFRGKNLDYCYSSIVLKTGPTFR